MTDLEEAEAIRATLCRDVADRTLEALTRGQALDDVEAQLAWLKTWDIASYRAGLQALYGVADIGLNNAAIDMGIRAGYLTALVELGKRPEKSKRTEERANSARGIANLERVNCRR